ncbi:MAG TPA: NADPH-dependent FMN reductase [Gaiellaceae bacterium]|nr:NADPH-dependent FMN reductase [Gaiellaceae bacterium]
MRILGISGSLRRDSYNTRLLAAAGALLPDDAELHRWEGLAAVPPFSEDLESRPAPPAVAELRDALRAADAVLFATPEYNGSVPGQLKNALDWASRPHATNPLRNLPAAVIGASPGGFGAVWAQADLRRILSRIGARVVDAELAVSLASSRFGGDGSLSDGDLARELEEIVDTLLASARSRELVAA